ncbi:MAG: cytochrome bc complex cytochrome b subunit [Deltaproteobacteria bacterium]|jgi:quinol-cytochrome oxidoreductase complex cytochrome b subunit|nr:cytochrome bc complex cytochrome b subunit [Deltaproteobacteria bacterium]
MTDPRSSRGARMLDWLTRRMNVTEIFSLLTSYGLFYTELDTRKSLPDALEEALDRPLPSLARWPRILGLVVVVLLAILILTGALLAFYYLPTPDTAHASVGIILRELSFGWLIHNVHYWAAQLLLVVLVLRVLRFFFRASYRKPRELVWVFAVALLLVCFHAELTGRFLPWTSTAYWSITRSLEVVAAVPIYGSLVSFFAGAGGALVSDLTLLRFYILHIAVLPLLAVALIYFHFSSVRRIGIVDFDEEDRQPGRQALRKHIFNLLILMTALVGLLVTLATLAPTPFLEEADAFSTPTGVGPPWYLLSSYGFLELTSKVVPAWIGGSLLFLFFTGFLTWPFIDRSRSPAVVRWGIGVALLALWAALTLYGWRIA